jgi:MSHA biogenesis protein MshJ
MVTLPLLLLIIIQLLVVQPLETEKKNFAAKIQSVSVDLNQLNEQLETTQKLLSVSSKVKLGKQLKSLEVQIEQQKKLLKQLTDNLIAPQQMAVMVEKLLKQRGRLKLLSLKNLEPIGLPEKTSTDTPANEENNQNIETKNSDQAEQTPVLVYRHPLEIKLKGRYFEVLNYLKALENNEYNFYWEKLDYRVDKYPLAEVTIKLSTLGTEPQWIGANSNVE